MIIVWIALKKWFWAHDALLGLADCRIVNLWFLKGNILYLFLGRQFEGIWWQSIYATPLRCVSILVRWLFFLKGIYPVSLSQSTYLFLRMKLKQAPHFSGKLGQSRDTKRIAFSLLLGGKGGAVVRALASHRCGPGSNPGVDAICGLSLLLVLSLAPRGFSPGTLVFPSPQKPTLPNSNSIWSARTRLNEFIWTL